jgi:hypothetical protein
MKPDNSNETKIAIIGNNIEYVKKDIAEIKASIKDLSGVYLTKQEYDDSRRQLLDRLSQLEQSSNLWKWLSPTLSAIITAVLTLLTISYLDKLK